MILSTTPAIEGKPVSVHLGVVAAEVIFGANFVKDFLADGSDLLGGRNGVYEKVFRDAREQALKDLEKRASERGANAVLGLRLEYQVLGAANGMLMVAAAGTAVCIPQTAEEQRREEEDLAVHFVDIGGQRRGPFSVIQLRELKEKARLEPSTVTFTEDGTEGRTIGDLLSTPPGRL